MKHLLLFLFLLAGTAVAFNWYASPSTNTSGDGSGSSRANAFKGLLNVNWAVMQPGDTLFLRADLGPYTVFPSEYLRPAVSGSALQPFVVSNEPGQTPLLDSSLILLEANVSYVVVQGLSVRRSPYAAAIIRGRASHTTIANCSLAVSGQGLHFSEDAGGDNIAVDCIILNNAMNGVGVDKNVCTAGHENILSGCLVAGNGCHGIEVNGNGFIVEGNTFLDNGGKVTGTSAIHVYGGGMEGTPADGFGYDNIIRYNFCSGQKEPGNGTYGTDGNGIQLDQYTANNQVYYNICMNNDMAGIILYDSRNNTITNNTLLSNCKDSLRLHVTPFGDLYVGSTDALYAVNRHSAGNLFRNNLSVSYRTYGFGVFMDEKSSLGLNQFSGNHYDNRVNSAHVWRWVNDSGNGQAGWNNAVAGTDFTAPLPEMPAQPLSPEDAKITTLSALYRNGINAGLTRDYFNGPVTAPPSIGAHQGDASSPVHEKRLGSERMPAAGSRLLYATPILSHFRIVYRIGPDGNGLPALSITDVTGRTVCGLPLNANAGTHVAEWNGCDANGKRVGPGCYLVRFAGKVRDAQALKLMVAR